MEYLSRCLIEVSVNGSFKNHPRCWNNGITHLLFIDDLLMFFYEHVGSGKALCDVFHKFSQA